MPRFWNLQTKFVAVLVVLLLASLVAQSYVHQQGKELLRKEVLQLTEDVANEVTEAVTEAVSPVFLVGVQVQPQVVVQVNRPTTGRAGGERRPAGKIWTKEAFKMRLSLDPKRLQEIVKDRYEELCRNQAPTFADLRRAQQGQGLRVQEEGNDALAPTLDGEVHRSEVHEGEVARHNGGGLFALRAEDEDPLLEQLPGTLIWKAGGRPGSSPQPIQGPLASTSMQIQQSNFDAAPVDLGGYADRVDMLLDEDRRKTLLSLLAIFLSGIGAAWFLGNRMTRPVHSLVAGFQRVADGDLGTHVPERSRGEFGVLGRQFNAMVGRLRNSRQLQRELELRERVQHMGDLAAGVAHDVRNPLNAIYLNIGQIRDEFLPSGQEKQQRFLRFTSDIRSEVERLNELVTNFLSLAQPSSGDREEVSPNELVEDLGRLLDKEAASRHVTIATTLDPGLPTLECNQQELRSAFLNVAMNAIQAMDGAASGRLDIVTGQRHDSEQGGGTEVAISFIDSGCGIAPEQLEQIFIPYFTTREGGTGLGMAISRRIAERYGGRIEVLSQVGEGTTVSFVFPATNAADLTVEGQA